LGDGKSVGPYSPVQAANGATTFEIATRGYWQIETIDAFGQLKRAIQAAGNSVLPGLLADQLPIQFETVLADQDD
jgi:hypothetical protein